MKNAKNNEIRDYEHNCRGFYSLILKKLNNKTMFHVIQSYHRNNKAPHSGGVPKNVGRQRPYDTSAALGYNEYFWLLFVMNCNVLESRTLVLKVVPFTLTFAIARGCCVTAADSDCVLLQ